MRMSAEDSPVSVEAVPVETVVDGGVAAPAPVVLVKGDGSSDGANSVATPPPVPVEKLHGQELLEALKKQVGYNRTKGWGR